MRKFYLLCFSLITAVSGYSQCPNDNIQSGPNEAAPTELNVPTYIATCIEGGEYIVVDNVIEGNQYAFSTCGLAGWDTQITIYDAVTGVSLDYNDDYNLEYFEDSNSDLM